MVMWPCCSGRPCGLRIRPGCDYWYPEHERSVVWDDPDLAIDWPLDGAVPQLAAKDAQAPRLAEAEVYD